jgi:oligosaccharide repeat unit polymerase
VVVLASTLAFVASYVPTAVLAGRSRRGAGRSGQYGQGLYESGLLELKLKRLILFWGILSLVEIAVSRGVPLFNRSIDYTQFGIHSLHGFLNAVVIVFSNYAIYFYLTRKRRKYVGYFLLCLLWPMLLLTRQLLMSMILQALLIYITIRGLKWRQFLIVLVAVLVVIVLFGVIGDARSGGGFRKLALPSENYPDWLPSGFLWVYLYATSSLSNTNYNISQYTDIRFGLVQFVGNFMPSVLKDRLIIGGSEIDYQLSNKTFNVGTGMEEFLVGWGSWGTVFIMFLVGIAYNLVYDRARVDENIKWKMIVVVLIHNIILSIFANFMTSLVFLFQCLLHYYLGTTYYFYKRPSLG